MSRESHLTTVALLIGVLAGLTTILGYLGWHPHWERTTGSAEPTESEPAKELAAPEPIKAPAPVPEPVKAPAPVPQPPRKRADAVDPAKETAVTGSASAAAAAPERAIERAVPASSAPIPPAPVPEKDHPRLGGKHRKNR
jgi:hypothetical protein